MDDAFEVFSGAWVLQCPSSNSGGRAALGLVAIFEALLADLRHAGMPFIGHIKAVVDAGVAGQVALSVTRYDEGLRVEGQFTGEFSGFELALNVILVRPTAYKAAELISGAWLQAVFDRVMTPG